MSRVCHVSFMVSGLVEVSDPAGVETDPTGAEVEVRLDVLKPSFQISNASIFSPEPIPAEVLHEACRVLLDFAAKNAQPQSVREPEAGPTQPGGQA